MPLSVVDTRHNNTKQSKNRPSSKKDKSFGSRNSADRGSNWWSAVTTRINKYEAKIQKYQLWVDQTERGEITLRFFCRCRGEEALQPPQPTFSSQQQSLAYHTPPYCCKPNHNNLFENWTIFIELPVCCVVHSLLLVHVVETWNTHWRGMELRCLRFSSFWFVRVRILSQ